MLMVQCKLHAVELFSSEYWKCASYFGCLCFNVVVFRYGNYKEAKSLNFVLLKNIIHSEIVWCFISTTMLIRCMLIWCDEVTVYRIFLTMLNNLFVSCNSSAAREPSMFTLATPDDRHPPFRLSVKKSPPPSNKIVDDRRLKVWPAH